MDIRIRVTSGNPWTAVPLSWAKEIKVVIVWIWERSNNSKQTSKEGIKE